MSKDTIKVFGENSTYFSDIEVTYSQFPAGEEYVKVDTTKLKSFDSVNIVILSSDSNTLLQACLIADAIKLFRPVIKVIGVFDYYSYGRQDRVCKEGESYSLKFISEMLSLRFDLIETHDVHSQKTIECLGTKFNSISYPSLYELGYIDVNEPTETFNLNENLDKDVTIICPDKGARNRSEALCKYLGTNDIIYFDKTRSNGNIEVIIESGNELLTTRNKFVVSDDITDFSTTHIVIYDFIKKYNPNAQVTLVLSHGIFSGGIKKLTSIYKNVFVVNDYYNTYRLKLMGNK